ncbi:hypothetical protein GJ496_003628 [Pomphorhynchus laevis]|nr:hypothetical protein GJ496_003628 [Pomphorhynchus laevis]
MDLPSQPLNGFDDKENLDTYDSCQYMQSLGYLNDLVDSSDQATNSPKEDIKCSTDLLTFMDQAQKAIHCQYYKTAVKINKTIYSLKDELTERKRYLMRVLDDAYNKEQTKLVQVALDVQNNNAPVDTSTRIEIMRCCDQLLNNSTTVFDFVSEDGQIQKLINENTGELSIKHLFYKEKKNSVSKWNMNSIDRMLSSCFESWSFNENRNSSYISPATHRSDVSFNQMNSLLFINNKQSDSSSLLTSGGAIDEVVSQWPLTKNSYYHPLVFNSDYQSFLPVSTDTYQSNKTEIQNLSDIVEPDLPLYSCQETTSAKTNNETASPISSNNIQGHSTDSATSVQTYDTSLLQRSWCSRNRLVQDVQRQTMEYHCKFGEYGSLFGQFTAASGVAVSLESDIIVADMDNHRIQIFDKNGQYKFNFGERGKLDGQLMYPSRVAVCKNTNDIIVTERNPTHQVQIYDQAGTFLRKFGSTVLQHPRCVCVDPFGNIIVAECKVMRVFIFDRCGKVINRFNCSKQLQFPTSICVNDKREIFISDNMAHYVKVFNYDGRLIRTIGGKGITNFPIGVNLDNSSNILVSDNYSHFNLTMFSQSGKLLAAGK